MIGEEHLDTQPADDNAAAQNSQSGSPPQTNTGATNTGATESGASKTGTAKFGVPRLGSSNRADDDSDELDDGQGSLPTVKLKRPNLALGDSELIMTNADNADPHGTGLTESGTTGSGSTGSGITGSGANEGTDKGTDLGNPGLGSPGLGNPGASSADDSEINGQRSASELEDSALESSHDDSDEGDDSAYDSGDLGDSDDADDADDADGADAPDESDDSTLTESSDDTDTDSSDASFPRDPTANAVDDGGDHGSDSSESSKTENERDDDASRESKPRRSLRPPSRGKTSGEMRIPRPIRPGQKPRSQPRKGSSRVDASIMQSLHNLTARTQHVESNTQKIARALVEIVKEGESRKRAYDVLYDEMRQYKENFLWQAQKPLFMDLITMFDSILRIEKKYEDREDMSDALSDFRYLKDELLEILYRYDIEPIEDHPERLDITFQKPIKRIDCSDPAEDRMVVQYVREGFTRDNMLLRPQEIVVKRYSESAAKGENEQ